MTDYQHINGYELIRREDLSDIGAEGILLSHRKSGARVVLIPCRDSNKVFNIAFRTPPRDSTGVAHIIEHTVLCGSKEFPLKDPFVELVKGSLNTFLNAMTYPDKTMYPVASTNETDFRNLMHVYLDAVFYPKIYQEEHIFRQEGWNYQLESVDGELKYNGVVYNEMKGVYSSADEILDRETLSALYPDTPYGVESGGDPDEIPNLTYRNYLDFHRTYYHPSNSYLYLYGNLDMEETLTFIDQNFLRHFDRIEVDSRIAVQKPFEQAKRVVRTYPISDDEEPDHKTYLSCNVSAGNPMDMKESIAMDVLDYALFSMPGAPVRQALLDAGIGDDVYGAYSDGIRQPYFTIVAKNAEEADEERFLAVIKKTLQEQVDGGINRDSLMAGINYLEFQFREADYQQYPKGLIYSMDIMDTWLYDEEEPFLPLKQLTVYRELREAMDHGYFEDLVGSAFLGNPHEAVVILKPERGLAQKKERELAQKLETYRRSLSLKEREELVKKTRDLKAYQEAEERPEDIATLPTLKISDIDRKVRDLSNRELKVAGVKTIWHGAVSSGIGYLDLYWDMKRIPQEDLPYAAILKAVLFQVDTSRHSYMDLTNRINQHTGGISAGLATFGDPKNEGDYQAFFGIRMKALYQEYGTGLALIREVLTESDFLDVKRLREIVAETRSHLQMALQQAGNSMAQLRAAAYLSPVDAYLDQIHGIGFYHFIRDLDAHFEERSDLLIEKLKSLVDRIFRKDGLLVSYTAEEAGLDALKDHLELVASIGADKKSLDFPRVLVRPLGLLNEGFMTSGQVQFVTMAGNYRPSVSPFNGAMAIFRQIMGYEYLWQNIRVKGGAYGCSAHFRRDGINGYASFRDPNLKRTREIYLSVPDYLKDFHADEAEMTKYIIGTISGMDQPLTPQTFGSVSMTCYLENRTKEERQLIRDQILDATEEDIRALEGAARTALKDGAFCVIGSEQAIRDNEDLFGHIEQLL